ncbi:hypothetical protein TKK_0015791 [Trichogramma kaykai]|uniref:protein-L-isoaspartate(D-aspartate) O-methyltransferase n=1 Tax=Trichogramma kaykai TaxID=54128 RepID=A0ABD2W9R5_9HYME
MMGFHGTTNLELVQYLKVSGVVESNLVFNTMKTIDRREFLIDRSKAYIDAPQQIGHGKTISAPHMHARTLEAFSEQLKNGKRALDIGSGTGYVTACMALALGSKGCVVAIECIPELRDKAKQIISNNYPALLKQDRVKLLYGDGKLGYACMGPYDIIHVGVAAAEIPQNLIDQLAVGGRLLMPVGTSAHEQAWMQIDKLPDGQIKQEKLHGRVHYGMMMAVTELDIENRHEFNNNVTKESAGNEIEDSSDSVQPVPSLPDRKELNAESQDDRNKDYETSDSDSDDEFSSVEVDSLDGKSHESQINVDQQQSEQTVFESNDSELPAWAKREAPSCIESDITDQESFVSDEEKNIILVNSQQIEELKQVTTDARNSQGQDIVDNKTVDTCDKIPEQTKNEQFAIKPSDTIITSHVKVDPNLTFIENEIQVDEKQQVCMEDDKMGDKLREKRDSGISEASIEEQEDEIKITDSSVESHQQNETQEKEKETEEAIKLCEPWEELEEKSEDYKEEFKMCRPWKELHSMNSIDEKIEESKEDLEIGEKSKELEQVSENQKIEENFEKDSVLEKPLETLTDDSDNLKKVEETCVANIIEYHHEADKNIESTKVTPDDVILNEFKSEENIEVMKVDTSTEENNKTNIKIGKDGTDDIKLIPDEINICEKSQTKPECELNNQSIKDKKETGNDAIIKSSDEIETNDKPVKKQVTFELDDDPENEILKNPVADEDPQTCNALVVNEPIQVADSNKNLKNEAAKKVLKLPPKPTTITVLEKKIKDQDKALIEVEKRNLKWNELQSELFEAMTQKIIALEKKIEDQALERTVSQKTILLQTNTTMQDFSRLEVEIKKSLTRLSRVEERVRKINGSRTSISECSESASIICDDQDCEALDQNNDLYEKIVNLEAKIKELEIVVKNHSINLITLEEKIIEDESVKAAKQNRDLKIIVEDRHYYSTLQNQLEIVAEKLSKLEGELEICKQNGTLQSTNMHTDKETENISELYREIERVVQKLEEAGKKQCNANAQKEEQLQSLIESVMKMEKLKDLSTTIHDELAKNSERIRQLEESIGQILSHHNDLKNNQDVDHETTKITECKHNNSQVMENHSSSKLTPSIIDLIDLMEKSVQVQKVIVEHKIADSESRFSSLKNAMKNIEDIEEQLVSLKN